MPERVALLACLNAEIDETSAFLALLDEEAELLTDSVSLDALPALSQAKQASVSRLGTLAQTRAQQVHAADPGQTYARTEDLAACDDALWEAWQTLLSLADEAHSLNQRNGALIAVHLRHTQESLLALRAASGAGELYSASGKPCVKPVHKLAISAA